MDSAVHILSWTTILIGCFFLFAGSLGLTRLPDFYTRLHAAGVTDTGGAGFIMAGLGLQGIFVYESFSVTIKLIFILFFMIFTGPAATHALAKAALHGGLKPKAELSDL